MLIATLNHYFKGLQRLDIARIYNFMWLMVLNWELCVIQIQAFDSLFFKILFAVLLLTSVFIFILLLKNFLSREIKPFLYNGWFWGTNATGLLLMITWYLTYMRYG